MFSLEGKVAVVTGGGSGIGLAVVQRFAQAGAKVVIADMKDQTQLADDIGGLFVQTDVSVEEDVKSLMQKAASVYGKIDIVINNAGIMTSELPIQEEQAADFTKMFNVNTLGVFFGMKHSVGYMKDGGAIVNTASAAGITGVANYSAYAASKWAVVGITKVAAIEFGPLNIRVNCICPASVNTPMLASQPGVELETLVSSTGAPLGRISQPKDVAALVHFLVAEDCDMVTGQAIAIDGGGTAGYSIAIGEILAQSIQSK